MTSLHASGLRNRLTGYLKVAGRAVASLWPVKRRSARVDYGKLHRWEPNYSEFNPDGDVCGLCGERTEHAVHLRPTRLFTLNDVARSYGGQMPMDGTMASFAMAVFVETPHAIVYEDELPNRYFGVVFVELPAHANAALFERVRRTVWWAKPCGVLVVVVGHGAFTYSAEDAEKWLVEGRCI